MMAFQDAWIKPSTAKESESVGIFTLDRQDVTEYKGDAGKESKHSRILVLTPQSINNTA